MWDNQHVYVYVYVYVYVCVLEFAWVWPLMIGCVCVCVCCTELSINMWDNQHSYRVSFQLRGVFFDLLSELSELDTKSQWKKVKSSIESDRRYEMIGSSAKREQFFVEYIHQLEVSLLYLPEACTSRYDYIAEV